MSRTERAYMDLPARTADELPHVIRDKARAEAAQIERKLPSYLRRARDLIVIAEAEIELGRWACVTAALGRAACLVRDSAGRAAEIKRLDRLADPRSLIPDP